jgi:hypothetical protein
VISLLYFLSTALIVFNLLVTAIYASLNLSDRPAEIRMYVGGSIDVSFGRYAFFKVLYSITSAAAFVSLWLTTTVLIKNYSKKLISSIAYWLLLSLPLAYFMADYFYQLIFTQLFSGYLTTNPVMVTIVLTAFLSLSKPIGGLTFGLVFWKISRTVSYERKIEAYMAISGWGVLLVFAASQALPQSLGPYPPFGLITNTVLIVGAYFMLVGIYNSARLVAINADLRKSLFKHAANSRLLSLIGRAEMDRELQKTVNKILQDKNIIESTKRTDLDLDGEELKKHLDFVIKEVGKLKD